ncbi:MAG TPA: branched-chain amino acid aminotransferase [Caulobacteraceae bacterium]|jgi:branched-chain amino acid aminotransferase|nr:branched-chain amino acid aminotransferase [Caulobacteraceae bacterium]
MPDVVSTHAPITQTWTFFEGAWHEGNVGIMGPRTHGAWLGTTVFDGARAFEGVTPDLDLHCMRINQSAERFLLKPVVPVEQWMELSREGIKRFAANTPIYIRPMYWADTSLVGGGVKYDPDSTRWCLCVYEAAMPEPRGLSVTLSPQRRPTIECAPVDAKAGCLYPNNARALMEAGRRGFDNCLLRDFLGNIAELANANVFMAKDGVVLTPAPNGTFLDGITRRRIIGLLRADGVSVIEKTLTFEDFLGADEIFSAGNFSKVMPIGRIEQRELQPGPLFRKARDLYWAFAHGG